MTRNEKQEKDQVMGVHHNKILYIYKPSYVLIHFDILVKLKVLKCISYL